jgi:hypothetical protein
MTAHRTSTLDRVGRRGMALVVMLRILLAVGGVLILTMGISLSSAAQGPFGDSPANVEGSSTSGGSPPSPKAQDILDAAQAAMPGEPQEGWAAGTVASKMPDPENPGSYYDMLFVAWVESDVSGLESQMAQADGDKQTVFTRWGSVQVLRSATGQMNDLAWRWADEGLARSRSPMSRPSPMRCTRPP